MSGVQFLVCFGVEKIGEAYPAVTQVGSAEFCV